MILRDLIQKSVYGTIGYIDSEESIDTLERYILYNLNNLKLFKSIIVATNYLNNSLEKPNEDLWNKYFTDVTFIHSKVNRGNGFGTADLDDAIVDYCISNNIGWLCKSANDMLIGFNLDMEIPDVDFYYMNGIGYGGMEKYNYNIQQIIKEDFYPQTNLYFINTSLLDYLNDKSHINYIYDKIVNDKSYNGKAWEYGFRSCETLLSECVDRNKLTTYHLIKPDTYNKLLNFIMHNKVHDPSHKNISIDGVCHFQYPNQTVYSL